MFRPFNVFYGIPMVQEEMLKEKRIKDAAKDILHVLEEHEIRHGEFLNVFERTVDLMDEVLDDTIIRSK